MPKLFVVKLLVALAAAAVLLAAAGAQAGTRCSASPCRATMRVGVRPVEWVSRQSFPDGAPVDVRLTVNGRELAMVAIRSCAARFYGEGVVARLDGCDRPRSRIRIRAVNVEPRAAVLRVRIRAD